ncbi:MAG: GNAT family N-acetyltransferase [Actinomycetota bacterium]|nr:GNAT family N-acetyltransferase [Actinomycetota bacterium]
MAVSPANRGEGLGEALMKECLRRAGANGAAEVGVQTSELMVAARPMYERMEFVRREELPPMFGVRYWSLSLELS